MTVPHSRPLFGELFADAIQQVIASGQVTMGAKAAELELLVAGLVRRDQGVAVDSGTSAITLALHALAQRGPVKKVGIPTYVCSSVLYAVRAAGCQPVCMDCGNDLRLLADEALGLAESLDAVVLVHPFGMVEPLVAESWPCPVIEDFAQAPGAGINGQPVGSFGDVSITSFYATKPWGGAYGGILLTDDHGMAEHVRAMRDPDGASQLQAYAGHHQLSDMHAAMAMARLSQAGEEMVARQVRETVMDEWFKGDSIQPILNLQNGNLYRYIIRTDGDAEHWINTMQQHGVMAMRPVKSPVSQLLGVEAAGAEAAWRDCISVPLLADASEAEMEKIHEAISIVVSEGATHA